MARLVGRGGRRVLLAEGMAWAKAQGGERTWDSRKLPEVLPPPRAWGARSAEGRRQQPPLLQGGTL